MALVTAQQISRYYKQFGGVEVTFNKNVIRATGLLSKNNLIKCKSEYWPCFIYSSSMQSSRIVASIKEDFYARLKEANSLVSVRFSFKQPDKVDPLVFFVSAKVTGFSPYGDSSSGLSLINLNYTQRPPDDLIVILGKLLETNLNSQKRKDERIILNDNVIRDIGIKSKSIIATIDSIPRKAILRDISFSGAKIIISGIAKFLVGKLVILTLEKEEDGSIFKVPGKILRYEPIANRKDIATIAVQFEDSLVPIEFKILINDYITSTKHKDNLRKEETK